MTAEALPLHWSVDRRHAQTPASGFHNDMLALLNRRYAETTHEEAGATLHLAYQVFPKFRCCFPPEHAPASRPKPCGTVSLLRSAPRGDKLHWEITFENRVAGEELRLHYRTLQSPAAPLAESWTVRTRNSTVDTYSGLALTGELAQKEIRFCINDKLAFREDRVDPAALLICNWSLLAPGQDGLAALAKSPFDLLEHLQTLRCGCTLRSLGKHAFPLERGEVTWHGYALHGSGAIPSIWWFDEKGNAALVSTTLTTFVSCQPPPGEEAE
jgi:hypothetical protein